MLKRFDDYPAATIAFHWPLHPRTSSVCTCAYWLLNGPADDSLEHYSNCFDDTCEAGLVWW